MHNHGSEYRAISLVLLSSSFAIFSINIIAYVLCILLCREYHFRISIAGVLNCLSVVAIINDIAYARYDSRTIFFSELILENSARGEDGVAFNKHPIELKRKQKFFVLGWWWIVTFIIAVAEIADPIGVKYDF